MIKDTKDIAHKALAKFKRKGMVCRIVGLSDYGSYYIHFKGNTSGVRVSNHKEKDGICYRYNIRTDIEKSYNHEGRDYFSAKDVGKAINIILKNEKIKY